MSEPAPRPSGPGATVDLDAAVAAARLGDRDAFATLVRATSARAYGLALRLTGDEHDALDVVQEAYLRAWRGLPRFRGDARFTTWLHRIVANCAARQLRRRRRHLPLESAPVLLEASEAPETDLRRDLTVALADLPPRLRHVVVLRDVYDLPHDEIADALGISAGAAKVRLHRARRALRQRLLAPETPRTDTGATRRSTRAL